MMKIFFHGFQDSTFSKTMEQVYIIFMICFLQGQMKGVGEYLESPTDGA